MKSLILIVLGLIMTSYTVMSQDKVYGSFMNNDYFSEVKSITVNPSTGVCSGNFGNTMYVQSTAAIGYGSYNNVGYIVSLQYTTNEHVDIYARKADGTGSNVKIKNDADLASGDIDLDYVRLGIDQNGIGWIVSKRSSNNTIYVASFTWNGSLSNPSVNVTKRGTLGTNDNSNSVFINGDLAIASNTAFILANNGIGTTKIYTISLATLLNCNGSSNSILTSKWDLRKLDGTQFGGSVNGFAFSSTGSAYLSTSGGLYFIDQTTVNSVGNGTVKCLLIHDTDNLSDLATGNWPVATALPAKLSNIKVTLTHSKSKN